MVIYVGRSLRLSVSASQPKALRYDSGIPDLITYYLYENYYQYNQFSKEIIAYLPWVNKHSILAINVRPLINDISITLLRFGDNI